MFDRPQSSDLRTEAIKLLAEYSPESLFLNLFLSQAKVDWLWVVFGKDIVMRVTRLFDDPVCVNNEIKMLINLVFRQTI